MRKCKTCDAVLLMCSVKGWLTCLAGNQPALCCAEPDQSATVWTELLGHQGIPFALLGVREALRQGRIRTAMEMAELGTFVRLP